MKKLLGILTVLVLLGLCACALADIAIDEAHFPDLYFQQYLRTWWDNDDDGILSDFELSQIKSVTISDMQIAYHEELKNLQSLEGVKLLPELTDITCSGTALTSLDVSGMTKLSTLNCFENAMTTLDITDCSSLIVLYVWGNQISTLRMGNNPELAYVDVRQNRLPSLDFTGCAKLKRLDCFENELTSLKLNSSNPDLKFLECYRNRLTSLDVSNCPALQDLYCHANRIAKINVSNSPLVTEAVQKGNRRNQTQTLSDGTRLEYDYFSNYSDVEGHCSVDHFVTVTAGSFVSGPTSAYVPTDEDKITVSGGVYCVFGGDAMFLSPKSKTAKKLTIQDTIKAPDGKSYKVTQISDNACKGMKKLTTLVIGKNVKTIGKNAFYKCAKLKTITIKTTKLTTKTVGANAFKGVYKKATVKVPAKKLKAYKTLLVKKGLPKTAKVKK